jgi:hypothetical protein
VAYQLDIQENALDSFNEALAKYREGETGKLSAYKFAILHMAHFLELVLKMYVQTLDENLVYVASFRLLEKDANAAGEDLLRHLLKRQAEGKHFPQPAGGSPAKTIFVADALALAKLERCKVTGVLFVDQEFIDDIEWLKGLRNNIEHFHFELEPRDVRLCLGRIVRRAEEFADDFSLFGLATQVSAENAELFEQLADEYENRIREARLEVKEKTYEAFRGVRHKFHDQVGWNVYECPECREETLIPSDESASGYRCTLCGNEESDEIEERCDICGIKAPGDEMELWKIDEHEFERRCYFCSGNYALDRDRD